MQRHGGVIGVRSSRQTTVVDQGALKATLREQCGVISRRQALDAGVTRGAIREHLRSGRWQRIYPGVYATFSGELPRMARLWSVVLAAGPGAALSHGTAAELLGLTDRTSPIIHVMVPHERRVVAMPGVAVHRRRDLARLRHPAQRPPRTRVEETIIDLAQDEPALEDAYGWLARGVGAGLTRTDRLIEALKRRTRVRRRRLLMEGLGDVASGCRSVLELAYLNRVERAHGLPSGQRQARVTRGGRRNYLDVLYRDFRTAVELDGEAVHPYSARFKDARRDNAGVLDGLAPLRYGTADVLTRYCEIADEVSRVLSRNGCPTRPRRCANPGCLIARG